MKPLWKSWAAVERRLRRAPSLLMLLDYDGTLSPLANHPARARLPADTRGLLSRLNSRSRVRVAVVSGRGLSDVAGRVGLPALIYAGNHGLEIQGHGLSFRHPDALRHRSALRGFARRARRELKPVAGALVEDKGLSLSLHFRNVAARDRPRFRRALRALRRNGEELSFLWRRGLQVWEVLPAVAWNKGSAAALLRRRVRPALTIAVGDDATDETMFTALSGPALTIRVAPHGPTDADYVLPEQRHVPCFLEAVDHLIGGSHAPHALPLPRPA